MMMKRKPPKVKLDKEEQAISDSFDRGEWVSVENKKKETAKAKIAASNYLRKDARVNIRLSSIDLNQIKQIAAYEGLPYQTFIASILHKFAAGHPKKNKLK